jgi:hypothetical protein
MEVGVAIVALRSLLENRYKLLPTGYSLLPAIINPEMAKLIKAN